MLSYFAQRSKPKEGIFVWREDNGHCMDVEAIDEPVDQGC